MSRRDNLMLLIHRVASDPTFRKELLADPASAVQDAGFDLLPQDMEALQAWHANIRDVTKVDELESSLRTFVDSRLS